MTGPGGLIILMSARMAEILTPLTIRLHWEARGPRREIETMIQPWERRATNPRVFMVLLLLGPQMLAVAVRPTKTKITVA